MLKRSVVQVAQWTGECADCGEGAVLSLRKADGRWTLRQLFTDAWLESSFRVDCGRCDNSHWLYLDALDTVDLAERLNLVRRGAHEFVAA